MNDRIFGDVYKKGEHGFRIIRKVKLYARVKINLPKGKTKIIWAEKRIAGDYVVFERVDKKGNRLNKRHIFIATEMDVVWEKQAIMSKKYALLEVVK